MMINSNANIKVAVVGCCHGELERIYEQIQLQNAASETKVDLLLICGDFQGVRNKCDLECMNVPNKYKALKDFPKYYRGELNAPVLTIFIGGNHEASNYLQELYFGGYIAKNIYYIGRAGVITVKTPKGSLVIGGISGIFNRYNYLRRMTERPPYDNDTIRSVYHVRSLHMLQLAIFQRYSNAQVDIFLSHDWPRGIEQYGDIKALLKAKPFFRKEVFQNRLGSPVNETVMSIIQPRYWFSAHLHTKFEASKNYPETGKTTNFLALDKCLPKKKYIQYMDIAPTLKTTSETISIEHHISWLSTLLCTKEYISTNRNMPNVYPNKFSFATVESFVSKAEFTQMVCQLQLKAGICYIDPFTQHEHKHSYKADIMQQGNRQTDLFIERLSLDHHGITVPQQSVDPNSISID